MDKRAKDKALSLALLGFIFAEGYSALQSKASAAGGAGAAGGGGGAVVQQEAPAPVTTPTTTPPVSTPSTPPAEVPPAAFTPSDWQQAIINNVPASSFVYVAGQNGWGAEVYTPGGTPKVIGYWPWGEPMVTNSSGGGIQVIPIYG